MQDHAAFVQKDLQNYLNTKDFHTVFTKMVEAILEEKPSNPILYMVQHLLDEYPHETIAITQMFKVQTDVDALPTTPRSKGKEDNSDDDDDDADDDFMAAKRKKRAMAVSGESLNPNDIKELLEDLPSYEKSQEDGKELLEIVGSSPFLNNLAEDQRQRIVSAFQRVPDITPAGSDIIKKGDFGDVLYCVLRGEVDVFRSRGGEQEEELVFTYPPRSTFGELALLYNSPRAATCRAKTDCVLYTLDRYTFKVLALAACTQRREMYMGFLSQVSVLSSMSDMELMALADAMGEDEYPGDSVVCREGDRGDHFFIIRDGEAIVTKKNFETGYENVVASLKKGKHFGEIALLTHKPRTATVRAAPKQTLKVLVIERATFKRILGPLEEIMKRDMNLYNDFFSQGI